MYVIGMVLGCAVAYLFGTFWFMFSMGTGMKYTLSVCVIPFIPFDIAKIVAVAIVGTLVKKLLHKIDGLQTVIKY